MQRSHEGIIVSIAGGRSQFLNVSVSVSVGSYSYATNCPQVFLDRRKLFCMWDGFGSR